MAWLNQPFFQLTLPLIVTFVVSIWAASWAQNKRLDGMSQRLDGRMDDIIRRLDRIEELLLNHDRRITALEERTSPLARTR